MFRCQRWTLANILPVAFMLSMIATIWILYTCLHIVPLLVGDVIRTGCSEQSLLENKVTIISNPIIAQEGCVQAAFTRGAVEGVIQFTLTLLLLICFGRAIFTDPGSVPDEPEWLPDNSYSCRGPEEIGSEVATKKPPRHREVKHTGARRFCKWCNRYKPDRAHHCRVCRSCILRMDHHCPWIANCVGFRNHKYFFLLVLYSLVDCLFVIATMTESLHRSVIQETQFAHRFLIVFCMTLAAMMGVLLVLFFSFHSWLMLRATTTIEFCEKTYRHSGGSHRGSTRSIYERDTLDNMKAVLGPNILLWFLPTSPPHGNGLSFKIAEETDDDSDSETTALLSKSKAQEKQERKEAAKALLESTAETSYLSSYGDPRYAPDKYDNIKNTPDKDFDGKKLATTPSSNAPEAADEEAPEVTAREASLY